MRTALIGLGIALLLVAGSPSARNKEAATPVKFSPTLFADQQQAILEGLRGKAYAELSDEDRRAVLDALSRMAARLEGVESLEQMDKRDQTAVFNDQELVNTLLTRAAADSRLICRRERFVGSHRTTNVCLTVAERRRLTEAAQNQMYGWQGSGYLEPERSDVNPRPRGPTP